MATQVNRLVGQHVSSVSQTHAGLSLLFEEGGRLTILNPWTLNDGGPSRLAGCALMSISDEGKTLSFKFIGDVALTVDLHEEVWTGPEAVVLSLPGGPIIVWN